MAKTAQSSLMRELSVQFGCGMVCPGGWQNFDVSPTMLMARLPLLRKFKRLPAWNPKVRYGDIVRGLPVKDNTAKRVYCDQVLEHLTLEHCRLALRNVFKILAKGGVFRLFVPDLAHFCRLYTEASSRGKVDAAHDFIIDTGLGLKSRRVGVLGRILDAFGNSHHLWGWDEASMRKELAAAGFVDIRRTKYLETNDTEFREIEKFSEFRNCDKSLGMEASK